MTDMKGTVVGRIASNDGQIAVITLPSGEPLKIHRSKLQTEDYFLLQWAVGKDVIVG
jgi:hypothetical protein